VDRSRTEYWKGHYDRLADRGSPWLDYSNARVQAQTHALTLEAAGPLVGKSCLDFGCGRGQLAACVSSLGASPVTGVDFVDTMLQENAVKVPAVHWLAGGVEALPAPERFDIVFLIEVLQYLPFRETLREIWRHVSPGGRIVAVVPHKDCPIVQRAASRFGGYYLPLTVGELAGWAGTEPGVAWWAARGFAFREDQTLAPYEVTPWCREPVWSSPPNRLQFVAVRDGGGESGAP
jgi:SAM-dependent methyltransferase